MRPQRVTAHVYAVFTCEGGGDGCPEEGTGGIGAMEFTAAGNGPSWSVSPLPREDG